MVYHFITNNELRSNYKNRFFCENVQVNNYSFWPCKICFNIIFAGVHKYWNRFCCCVSCISSYKMEIFFSLHKSIRENYIQTTATCFLLIFLLTLSPVMLLYICQYMTCYLRIDFSDISLLIHDKSGFRTLLLISILTTMPMLFDSLFDISSVFSNLNGSAKIIYRMLLAGAIIIPNLIRYITLSYEDLVIDAAGDSLIYLQPMLIILILQMPIYFQPNK